MRPTPLVDASADGPLTRSVPVTALSSGSVRRFTIGRVGYSAAAVDSAAPSDSVRPRRGLARASRVCANGQEARLRQAPLATRAEGHDAVTATRGGSCRSLEARFGAALLRFRLGQNRMRHTAPWARTSEIPAQPMLARGDARLRCFCAFIAVGDDVVLRLALTLRPHLGPPGSVLSRHVCVSCQTPRRPVHPPMAVSGRLSY